MFSNNIGVTTEGDRTGRVGVLRVHGNNCNYAEKFQASTKNFRMFEYLSILPWY